MRGDIELLKQELRSVSLSINSMKRLLEEDECVLCMAQENLRNVCVPHIFSKVDYMNIHAPRIRLCDDCGSKLYHLTDAKLTSPSARINTITISGNSAASEETVSNYYLMKHGITLERCQPGNVYDIGVPDFKYSVGDKTYWVEAKAFSDGLRRSQINWLCENPYEDVTYVWVYGGVKNGQ
jgi:hypothetical protein